MKRVGMLFCIFAIILFCTGQAFCEDPITIGLLGPMTGRWAHEGVQMKQVVELLAEKSNADGGLLGKKIRVAVEDDAGDEKRAVAAAQKLIALKPIAFIGTYSSTMTAAVQPLLDKAGIIHIANGSTAVELSEKGYKYFFRTCPRDDDQSDTAAQAIINHGFRRVAILHDNTLYSTSLASRTKELLSDEGVEIVFDDALTPGNKDYRMILNIMKERQPEVIFFTGYYPEAGVLLKQKQEMLWTVTFIGGDAAYSTELVAIAGKKAAEGFYFLSLPLIQNLPSIKAEKLLYEFQKKYGESLDSIYALLAGDAFTVIAAAVAATGTTDPQRIASYLHNEMKYFQGLSGIFKRNFTAKVL